MYLHCMLLFTMYFHIQYNLVYFILFKYLHAHISLYDIIINDNHICAPKLDGCECVISLNLNINPEVDPYLLTRCLAVCFP